VDLDAGDVPAGAAAAYYIFANRTDDSTTFTLTVNTVSTEAASQRLIGRFYWDGSKIVKDSVRSEFSDLIADLLYFVDAQVCNGRLTLSTGVPIPTSDISSSANVYFTPYFGNRAALYVQDYGWRLYSFSELTLDVSGIADAKNIDVWLYDNAGALTLAYTEWSNDTLRATALVRQDGILVKSGAPEYRYLGSVRTSGAGVSCDTEANRLLWNYYNRVLTKVLCKDPTNSWDYTTNTWRSANNNSTPGEGRYLVLVGVAEDVSHHISVAPYQNTNAVVARIGIGIDKTDGSDSDLMGLSQPAAGTFFVFRSSLITLLPVGYHYLQRVERSDATGTSTWYGDNNEPEIVQSGMEGWIMR